MIFLVASHLGLCCDTASTSSATIKRNKSTPLATIVATRDPDFAGMISSANQRPKLSPESSPVSAPSALRAVTPPLGMHVLHQHKTIIRRATRCNHKGMRIDSYAASVSDGPMPTARCPKSARLGNASLRSWGTTETSRASLCKSANTTSVGIGDGRDQNCPVLRNFALVHLRSV